MELSCLVSFTTNQESLDRLIAEQFYLVVFKAVKTEFQSEPALWFTTPCTQLSLTIKFGWMESEKLVTYTSSADQLAEFGNPISIENAYEMSLGQLLAINHEDGTGIIYESLGIPGSVLVANNLEKRQITGGILEVNPVGGPPTTTCNVIFRPGQPFAIYPTQYIVFGFTKNAGSTGMALNQIQTSAVMADLSKVTSISGITFDLNSAWDVGASSNCTILQEGTDLTPYLIRPS